MMSDQEFYDRFDSALKRGAILSLLFAAMCLTAVLAEQLGAAYP